MYQYRPDHARSRPLLATRQNGSSGEGGGSLGNVGLIIVITFVGVALVAAAVYGILRAVRRKHSNPKYVPGRFLKERWSLWGTNSRGIYEPASLAEPSSNIGTRTAAAAVGHGGNNNSTRTGTAAAPVDRNTSVRSIMTLPPYRLDPANTERVIGREGERDGVDMVVEMPTEENLETLREDEMESLYQIRLARRQQNAERERRREDRRAARERNDDLALEALGAGGRAASGENRVVLEGLRAEHQRLKNQRRGAVPSVSYADVGVARHDGTRIRANSNESERVGLLSDAASIALGERRASGQRGRSDSAMSVGTGYHSPSVYRSRASSAAESARVSTHTRGESASSVGENYDEVDVGEGSMPLQEPPGYEDEGRSTTPTAEPPPGYPGRDTSPDQHSRGEAEESEARETGGADRPSGRSVDGRIPQLPSLRLGNVPRIVIEPSQDTISER